ncbi:MAG: discoidin domain-containing protein [Planctomycetes bacterium]|jgi:hypothetical protein|nr:discoidin domain-containing protein [Planctomycetota bacterium]
MDKRLIAPMLLLSLGFIGTATAADLTTGLVANWLFDGNFNDSAGTNHGAPKGDAKIVSDPQRGQVLELDGTGDYVEVPHSASLNITGDKLTMTVWVNHDDVTGNPEIVIAKVVNNTTHTSPYFSYGLHILNPSGSPRAWISRSSGGTYANTASVLLKSKQWHHLAGVYDGAQLRLYLDGKQVAITAATGNIVGYPNVLRLGINGGLTEPMDGKMDDVRIYNRALTAEEIAAVMMDVGAKAGMAKNPNPPHTAVDVPADTGLSWTAGKFAATHDVYLARVFADVNTAGRINPKGVLVSQGQTETSYQPAALLDYGRTYYWRVDEVNKAPDNTIFQGNPWSFTVEPYGYPIKPKSATASTSQTGMGPEKTIDGSGLDQSDLHGVEPTTMWLSTGVGPNWIQYEFDKVYRLHELTVWNSNQLIESFLGFGAKSVTIETSTDGTTWAPVSNVPEFARASGAAGYAANTTVSLGGVQAKFVKLTINRTWGGLPTTGLSEVRFSYVPVQARAPQPVAGATGVSVEATLSWRPGREAGSHAVYLDTSKDAVTNGTAAAVTVTDHSYSPAGLLYGTTYYWRVDEVGAAAAPGTQAGDVWSFTTQPYAVVDDMESYTDDEGSRIYETWIDGLTDAALGGSQAGYNVAPFAETKLFSGGKQSLPLTYSGTRSEAQRAFDLPQDWTAHGLTTLVLFFRGDPGNAGAPIYVKINGTRVPYNNGAASTTLPLWKQWNIDLASLGISLKSVKTLAVGVGDGSASTKGTIFIDEIRLYVTPPQVIVPTDPGKNGLAAWWAFDGDFKDSAGANHGTAKGDAKIVADAQRGQVLALDGIGDYMEVPNSPSLNITGDKIALTAWANFDSVAIVQMIVCKVFSNTTHVSPYFAYGLHTLANGQPRFWISRSGGASNRAGTAGMFKAQTWHHIAGVYNGAQLRLYIDGAFVGSTNATGNILGYDTVLRLGTNGALTETLAGKLDDVRIYNRALSEAEVRYLVGDR